MAPRNADVEEVTYGDEDVISFEARSAVISQACSRANCGAAAESRYRSPGDLSAAERNRPLMVDECLDF